MKSSTTAHVKKKPHLKTDRSGLQDRRFRPQAFIIVRNDSGAQAYWLLDRAEEIRDPAVIEKTLRNLGNCVDGSVDMKLDSMLWLPDTPTDEGPDLPSGCFVSYFNARTRYPLEDLVDYALRRDRIFGPDSETPRADAIPHNRF